MTLIPRLTSLQFLVLWTNRRDKVDMGSKEIIGVATKFVKANCYSPNPKLF